MFPPYFSKGAPFGAPHLYSLAAAAIIIAATAAAIAASQEATAAAVAQQKDDHNDPANVAAAETVIITHIQIPPNFVAVNHRSFQDIPP